MPTLIKNNSDVSAFDDFNNHDAFSNFLTSIPSEKRAAELLKTDIFRIKIIIHILKSINNHLIVIKSLTSDQLFEVLNARHVSGDTIFSTLMPNLFAIRILAKNLEARHLFQLCTAYHPFFLNSVTVITSAVKNHWSESKYRKAIRAIFEALPLKERKALMYFKDNLGTSVNDTLNRNKRGRDFIAEMLFFPGADIKRELAKYVTMLLKHQYSGLNIKSYADLREEVNYFELRAEIKYFENITDIETLEQSVYERLHARFKGVDNHTIPFYKRVNTLTNQFYFDLMLALVDVDNLSDAIQYLSCRYHHPSEKYQQLLVEIPEVFPEGLSYSQKVSFFRNAKPNVLVRKSESGLSQMSASLSDLSACVFSDDGEVVLNLTAINRFSFKRHCHLHKLLHLHYPDLAKRVYEHNAAWADLSHDIECVKRAGDTPREALTHLIKRLRLGGEAYTGQRGVAGEIALAAIAKFSDYFNHLPNELQNQLQLLVSNTYEFQLGDFFTKITEDVCVEWLSTLLQDVLESNPESECLNNRVGISPDYLNSLEKKCRHGLDVQQSSEVSPDEIPEALGKEIIEHMDFSDKRNLCYILNTMPNDLIHFFWKYADVRNDLDYIESLLHAMTGDIYLPEKLSVIKNAIYQNKEHLNDATMALLNRWIAPVLPEEEPVARFHP